MRELLSKYGVFILILVLVSIIIFIAKKRINLGKEFRRIPPPEPDSLSYDRDDYYAYALRLYNAMKGAGTDEEAVFQVFASMRNDEDIKAIYHAFNEVLQDHNDTGRGDLIDWLIDDQDEEEFADILKRLSNLKKGI